MLLYVFLLLIIGVPLFFMELAAGQSIRQGSIGVWKHISPKLAGIGYSSCMVRVLLCCSLDLGHGCSYMYKYVLAVGLGCSR